MEESKFVSKLILLKAFVIDETSTLTTLQLLMLNKMLQCLKQSKGVQRKVRKIQQVDTMNKRPHSRPRKSSLQDETFSALSEYSDKNEVGEAIVRNAEGALVSPHCTLWIRINFPSKIVP